VELQFDAPIELKARTFQQYLVIGKMWHHINDKDMVHADVYRVSVCGPNKNTFILPCPSAPGAHNMPRHATHQSIVTRCAQTKHKHYVRTHDGQEKASKTTKRNKFYGAPSVGNKISGSKLQWPFDVYA
jgi:hypothetical protein